MTHTPELIGRVRQRLLAGEVPYAIAMSVPVALTTIYQQRDALGIPPRPPGRFPSLTLEERRQRRRERQNRWRERRREMRGSE